MPSLRIEVAAEANLERGAPISAEGFDLFSALPGNYKLADKFADASLMEASTRQAAGLLALVPPLLRCECCGETRHVEPDTYGGTMLCACCAWQVTRVGRCCEHGSRVFYQDLCEAEPTCLDLAVPVAITSKFFTTDAARTSRPETALAPEPDL